MFLSIIIPVYNTEKYLDECLLSILHQDLLAEELEIVCVNDGSKDGSLEILRRYEQEYPNVVVIDQPNGGVCKARNAGLLAAKGDYIWYVDSDDFLRENCLAELKAVLEREKCDRLVVSNYLYYDDGNNGQKMEQNTSWEDSVVWRSLFRRSFLMERNLMFHYPELSFGEDALYMYEVKRQLPVCANWHEPVYFHRERPGSLSTEMSPETEIRRLRCNIREAQIMKGYCEQGGVLETETANRFMAFWLGCLYSIVQIPSREARMYLKEMKGAGLYPYTKPKECTTDHCPDNKRKDFVGRVIDTLYVNLGSPWGYWGMRMFFTAYRIKSKLFRGDNS